MNVRLSGSLIVALLPAVSAQAQPPHFDVDVWAERVDQYIATAGIVSADRMLWCDPVPDCEAIPLKPVDSDSGSATVIVFVGGAARRDQMEFLREEVRSIQASGGRVLQAVGLDYEFAYALRLRLSGR